MSSVWLTGSIATFWGIGIGGLFSFLIHGNKRSIGTIYSVCTGAILGLASFEIIPAALEKGSWITMVLGFLAGMVLFLLTHLFSDVSFRTLNMPHIKSGFLLAIAISIHNIPMGMTIGSIQQSDLTAALLSAVVMHNIPEGMILFAPLFLTGFRMIILFGFSAMVAVPFGIGAYIGGWIGIESDLIWSFLVTLSVGMIYMIAIREILPQAIRHSSHAYSLVVAVISFLLIGAYLLWI
ncbi:MULTISPECIES: ZIP family metal transporter [Bhargavaea]|uniref:ZIP family metal transporter n=1 Tax=Bhargavaea changchunensis TaxID=2134037 RepID=A0ABW2NF98_9BACL|nr:ZIP family metal transporter [Bhargavaea sp. CC-171006]